METAFPGADKCNYIDLANFIRGEEIKLLRYLFYARQDCRAKVLRKIASRRGEEAGVGTNGKKKSVELS